MCSGTHGHNVMISLHGAEVRHRSDSQAGSQVLPRSGDRFEWSICHTMKSIHCAPAWSGRQTHPDDRLAIP